MAAEDTVKINILADVKDAVLGFGKAALALAGITMSVKAVIQFVSQSVQEYLKAEEALAKMNAALKGTGGYSSTTSDMLADLAEQLMKVTKYGDEASKEALALMMSLGGMTAQMASEALPVIQDLAAGLGIDLTSAAMMYSKAAEGNTAALGRYGIKVDETLKGDDALAAVTAKITEKFGGMAQAMGDTASGSMTKLNNAFGEMKEELGRFVVGEAKGFVDWLTSVAFGMADVMERANNLRDALNAQAKGIANTSDLLTIATARYSDTSKKIKDIEVGITDSSTYQKYYNEAMAAGVKGIDGYLKLLRERAVVERLAMNNIDNLAKKEREVADAAATLARAAEVRENEVALAYAKTSEGQRKALEEQIAKYAKYVARFGDKAVREKAILEDLRATYNKTYPGPSSSHYTEKMRQLKELENAEERYEYSRVPEVDTGLEARERFAGKTEAEQERLEHINALRNEGNRLAEEAEKNVKKITEAEQKAADAAELWKKTMSDLSASFEAILVQAAEQGLYDLFYQMGQAAGGAGDAAESFREWFTSLMSKMGQLFIAAGLSAIIQGHFYVGIGLLLLGGVMAIAAGVASAEQNAAGDHPVEQAGLVHLAGGGIVRRPTMALIGEGGPEAVIPLGRGGGVTVNVYGSVWSADNLATTVARKLRR